MTKNKSYTIFLSVRLVAVFALMRPQSGMHQHVSRQSIRAVQSAFTDCADVNVPRPFVALEMVRKYFLVFEAFVALRAWERLK